VAAMIEGNGESLDLVGQGHWSRLVRRFLEQLLRPKWFQTDAVLAHARMFFNDFVVAATDDPELIAELEADKKKCQEWLSYMLLDFVVVDPELEDLPVAAALEWARKLGIEALFEKLLVKELKLKARDLKKLKAHAERPGEGERKAEEEAEEEED